MFLNFSATRTDIEASCELRPAALRTPLSVPPSVRQPERPARATDAPRTRGALSFVSFLRELLYQNFRFRSPALAIVHTHPLKRNDESYPIQDKPEGRVCFQHKMILKTTTAGRGHTAGECESPCSMLKVSRCRCAHVVKTSTTERGLAAPDSAFMGRGGGSSTNVGDQGHTLLRFPLPLEHLRKEIHTQRWPLARPTRFWLILRLENTVRATMRKCCKPCGKRSCRSC